MRSAIGLALVMLGMGLTLLPEDFQRVTRYPKAVAVGLVSQLVFLPVVGFLVASIVPMRPEIAVGLMVLSCSSSSFTRQSMAEKGFRR